MIVQNEMDILVASADPDEAQRLAENLDSLSHPVSRATSGEQILELLRRKLFYTAVIDLELSIDDTPALLYLANMPTLDLLIGIGPADDSEIETQARINGAHVFLARPINGHTLEEIQSLVRGPPYGLSA